MDGWLTHWDLVVWCDRVLLLSLLWMLTSKPSPKWDVEAAIWEGHKPREVQRDDPNQDAEAQHEWESWEDLPSAKQCEQQEEQK